MGRISSIWRLSTATIIVLAALGRSAHAGPPYVLDDPEPTDYRHFEIYAFETGTAVRGATDIQAGIDFNYGGAPDLQLTAVLPITYSTPAGSASPIGFGNIELAAKYRIVHQEDAVLDVAVFPRLFLPSGGEEQHVAFFLPIWAEKDWKDWSAFGGGGCELNRGGGDRDFCIGGVVVTRRVAAGLRPGVEVYHRSPDVQGGRATTSVAAGVIYDLTETYHLLGYVGRGVQNADETNQVTWYSSVLFTF